MMLVPFVLSSASVPRGALLPSDDAVQAKSALELCPVARFRAALAQVDAVLPQAVHHAGGAEAIVKTYESQYGSALCLGFNSSTWRPSSRPGRPGLVINAGEGTTGTTCLDELFDGLGLRSAHFADDLRRESLWNCTTASQRPDCTVAFDNYDVVSDSPVSDELPYILASHPHGLLAHAILTVRDPREWAEKRKQDHPTNLQAVPCSCRVGSAASLPGEEMMNVVPPCASPPYPSSSADGQHTTLIYDAWAACLVQQAGHSLTLLNLFEMSHVDLAIKLATELRGRGAFPADLSEADVTAALANKLGSTCSMLS
tara:strand:- start:342 stop:1283 length:942 start_codon:yes stop_codon:yes gene_type:complete